MTALPHATFVLAEQSAPPETPEMLLAGLITGCVWMSRQEEKILFNFGDQDRASQAFEAVSGMMGETDVSCTNAFPSTAYIAGLENVARTVVAMDGRRDNRHVKDMAASALALRKSTSRIGNIRSYDKSKAADLQPAIPAPLNTDLEQPQPDGRSDA